MGRGRGRARVIRYTVYVTPAALREAKGLPGNVRQRVKRAIGALADNPRPPDSKVLELLEVDAEARRLRIDNWRIVYAITELNQAIDVLAVRRRPPYDYGDLEELIVDVMQPEE
jgi:mRNA interferase RelE/StbE